MVQYYGRQTIGICLIRKVIAELPCWVAERLQILSLNNCTILEYKNFVQKEYRTLVDSFSEAQYTKKPIKIGFQRIILIIQSC